MPFKKKQEEEYDYGETTEKRKLPTIVKVGIVIIIVCVILLAIPSSLWEKLSSNTNGSFNKPLTGEVTVADIIAKYEELREESDASLYELSTHMVAKPEVGEVSDKDFDVASIYKNFVHDFDVPDKTTGVEPIYSEQDVQMNGYNELDNTIAFCFMEVTVVEILDTDLVKFNLTGTDNYLYVKYLVSGNKYEVGEETSVSVLKSLYNAEDENTGYAFYIGGEV